MKRLLMLLAASLAFVLPAYATADHLDGVLPLYADDAAALAAAKKQPDRHVLLYFGDHLN